MYSVHCTLSVYIVQCTLYTVQCILYIVHTHTYISIYIYIYRLRYVAIYHYTIIVNMWYHRWEVWLYNIDKLIISGLLD